MTHIADPVMRQRLFEVHCIRQRAHWGKNYDVARNWPQSEEDWRTVPHGSLCDANIHMAIWHLKVAQQIKDAELLR